MSTALPMLGHASQTHHQLLQQHDDAEDQMTQCLCLGDEAVIYQSGWWCSQHPSYFFEQAQDFESIAALTSFMFSRLTFIVTLYV
jgi:hypothetical protein